MIKMPDITTDGPEIKHPSDDPDGNKNYQSPHDFSIRTVHKATMTALKATDPIVTTDGPEIKHPSDDPDGNKNYQGPHDFSVRTVHKARPSFRGLALLLTE